MRSSIVTFLVLLLALAINLGCASTTETSDDQFNSVELTQCTEPRPEICTMEYDPVCATHKDGSRKTYSTGCTACSHKEVIGYNPEECE